MTEIHPFTKALLSWFEQYGRHDLPWQQNPTPYRVWVSEIMLQQTQVNTVINYYQRFIDKFSSIKLLSAASMDEVLNLWSGLGYYARARNLHRCAQLICQYYAGEFPQTIEQLIELPGIGRSTAGAVLSFSLKIRAAILDGNVKRVLTRYFAVAGSPAISAVNQQLWELANLLTPQQDFSKYNQAIMDLGATICTRGRPSCERCPVKAGCEAYAQNRQHEFPHTKKKSSLRVQKSTQMLIIQNSAGQILLEKRPPAGIWGGLWSFPQCDCGEDIAAWCVRQLHLVVLESQPQQIIKHIFTHFDFFIHPVTVTVATAPVLMEDSGRIWYDLADPLPGGVAAPISKLLKQLQGVL
jgi:A/G-specific adenine glycosylase